MRRLTIFAVLAVGLAAHAQTLSVAPASPVVGQDFVVYFDGNLVQGCGTKLVPTTEIEGNAITFAFEVTGCGAFFPESLPDPRTGLARVTAPGAYGVSMVYRSRGVVTGRKTLGTVVVGPAPQAARAAPALDGMWNVVEKPGWGLRITEGSGGQLFVVWYTYLFNEPHWYVSSNGLWTGPQEYSGALYDSYGGGILDRATYDWSTTIRQPYGVMSITSTGADTAVFAVKTGAATLQWNLARFKF